MYNIEDRHESVRFNLALPFGPESAAAIADERFTRRGEEARGLGPRGELATEARRS